MELKHRVVITLKSHRLTAPSTKMTFPFSVLEIHSFNLASLAQHFSVLHPVGEVDLSVLVHVGDAEDPLDDEVLALVAFLKNQRCEV